MILHDYIVKFSETADKDQYYYNAGLSQMMFVRDTLPSAFGMKCAVPHLAKIEAANIEVIQTHTTKSIELPVYSFYPIKAIHVVMRGNFYDWSISIDSKIHCKSIRTDGLFNRETNPHPHMMAGIPEKYIFGPMSKSDKKFSVYLPHDNCKVYSLIREIWLWGK